MSSSSSREKTSYYADDLASADGSKKKYGKTKYSKRSMECLQGDNSNVATKKAKLVWTRELKDRFLEAFNHLTPTKAAQPMKILKYMDMRDLTRENVSSHLQKYRISLKKKKEGGASAASNYGSGQSSLPSENSEKEGNEQIGTSSQRTYGNSNIGSLNLDKFGPRHGASSDNIVSPLGLSGNQANIGQSYSSYTNSLQQANSTNFGVAGGMSRGPASGSNTMEMHQQQSQARNFSLYNAHYPWLNYVGMQLADEREHFGSGQTRLNDYGIHGGDGLTNAAQNNNMSTVGARGVPAVGFSAAGEYSYSGFFHANYYQDPPACGSVNEQGNTSVQLPLQLQQQYGELRNGGQNDFANFNLMNNDSGNSVHPNPFGEGDISGYPSGPTNYQFPSQQQGGEGVLNLPSSSYHAEVSYQSNILNSNLFASSTVEENIDRWNAAGHPSPNMEDVIREINHYHPSSNPNPNDQLEGDNAHTNSELNNLNVVDNYASANQQQGGEGVLNLPSSSYHADVSSQSNILNPNLFASSTVEENIDRWNAAGHPSPNMEDLFREIDHYHPSTNPNPNDQLEDDNAHTNSKFNNLNVVDNCASANQQQGGEGVLNLPSSSYHAEVSSQSNILNPNLFASSTVEENIDPSNAADHPSANMEDAFLEIDHYYPSSNPNPNDQLEHDDAHTNSELNNLNVVDNYASANQQQGGEDVLMNPNLPSCSYHVEVSSQSIILNRNRFASGTVEENNNPWNAEDHPSPEPNIESLIHELDNDYYPSPDPNPNDQDLKELADSLLCDDPWPI